MKKNNNKPNKVLILIARSLSVCSFIALLIMSLLTYQHYTFKVFTPVWKFILSLNLAFPPIIILLLSYIVVLITGVSLRDSGKIISNYIRKEIFGSLLKMSILAALSLAGTATLLCIVNFSTPPYYEKFVKQLLGGESDDFAIVWKDIANIRKVNPLLAEEFSAVVKVFDERSKVNFGKIKPSNTRMRIIVRTLEANTHESWKEHPLRWHALGEAYSLYGAAASFTGIGLSPSDEQAKKFYKKSISFYRKVKESDSPQVTPLLRTSAASNIGNQYYYISDYKNAITAWREVNEKPNTSTWGNIIAVLVKTYKYEEAIKEGEIAKLWAEGSGKALFEPSPYSGILCNIGFARWWVGDYQKALEDFRDAVSVMDDEFNRINFAYALVLAGQEQAAIKYLRSFLKPVELDTQADIVSSSSNDRSGYFIWALTEPYANIPINAARLYLVMGEARTKSELELENAQSIEPLIGRVKKFLNNSSSSCKDFLLLPVTEERLGMLKGLKPNLSK